MTSKTIAYYERCIIGEFQQPFGRIYSNVMHAESNNIPCTVYHCTADILFAHMLKPLHS